MNEQLATILAGLLAPLVVSIISTPLIFSKTYIETYIRPSFSFSKETAKHFVKNTTLLYLPISLTWSGLLLALWLSPITTITTESTQTLAFVFIITIILYERLILSYPQAINKKLNLNQTGQFTPHIRKHKIILTNLVFLQLVLLLCVFFAIILLL